MYEKMFESWHPYLKEWSMLHILDGLLPSLDVLYENCTVLPEKGKVFRIFKEVPFSKVKVVVCGQDPYNNIYKGHPSACGVAFMTENGYKNMSIKNLEKKLSAEFGISVTLGPGVFKSWMEQGVMLINTSLTVELNKAGSHTTMWREWTDLLFKGLSLEKDLVWLLMGNHAKSYSDIITSGSIVTSAHPVARNGEFLSGPDVFKRVNQELTSLGKKEVKWG